MGCLPGVRDTPRGYRIDAVLISDNVILPIEFKSTTADAAALRQAEDYGLELADFHRESVSHPIAPVLCAGEASYSPSNLSSLPRSGVTTVSTTPPAQLAETLAQVEQHFRQFNKVPIDT